MSRVFVVSALFLSFSFEDALKNLCTCERIIAHMAKNPNAKKISDLRDKFIERIGVFSRIEGGLHKVCHEWFWVTALALIIIKVFQMPSGIEREMAFIKYCFFGMFCFILLFILFFLLERHFSIRSIRFESWSSPFLIYWVSKSLSTMHMRLLRAARFQNRFKVVFIVSTASRRFFLLFFSCFFLG